MVRILVATCVVALASAKGPSATPPSDMPQKFVHSQDGRMIQWLQKERVWHSSPFHCTYEPLDQSHCHGRFSPTPEPHHCPRWSCPAPVNNNTRPITPPSDFCEDFKSMEPNITATSECASCQYSHYGFYYAEFCAEDGASVWFVNYGRDDCSNATAGGYEDSFHNAEEVGEDRDTRALHCAEDNLDFYFSGVGFSGQLYCVTDGHDVHDQHQYQSSPCQNVVERYTLMARWKEIAPAVELV